MIKQSSIISLIFTIILTLGYAQQSANQFDKEGRRHGLWTKNYHQTNQKRYEGVFEHGKEIDSFKYYTLSNGESILSAIKVFNYNDSLSDITFLASNKKVISKGRMNGKRFIGQWVFYHKNSTSKMIDENYNNDGELDGERSVYYKNGLIAEKAFYKNGKLDGEAKWFSENEILLKWSHYKGGELNGKIINYDSEGHITSEGNYVNDRKDGIWNYYRAGKLTKEINHTSQKVIRKKQ